MFQKREHLLQRRKDVSAVSHSVPVAWKLPARDPTGGRLRILCRALLWIGIISVCAFLIRSSLSSSRHASRNGPSAPSPAPAGLNLTKLSITAAAVGSLEPLVLLLTLNSSISRLFIPTDYHILHAAFPSQTMPSAPFSLDLHDLRPHLSPRRFQALYRRLDFRTFAEVPQTFPLAGSLCDTTHFVPVETLAATRVEPYEWAPRVAPEGEWWPLFLVKYIMTGQAVRHNELGRWKDRPVAAWSMSCVEGGGGQVAWDILKASASRDDWEPCAAPGGEDLWRRVRAVARGEHSERAARALRALQAFGQGCGGS